jgi:hypothetical protein
MTPKEKAKELVDKFKKHAKENRTSLGATPGMFKNINHPKQCALIAVDELIENLPDTDYWKYVKREIEKL